MRILERSLPNILAKRPSTVKQGPVTVVSSARESNAIANNVSSAKAATTHSVSSAPSAITLPVSSRKEMIVAKRSDSTTPDAGANSGTSSDSDFENETGSETEADTGVELDDTESETNSEPGDAQARAILRKSKKSIKGTKGKKGKKEKGKQKSKSVCCPAAIVLGHVVLT